MAREPSSTAQHVALARAHLTWMGVVDDQLAETMLRPRWARMARALRGPLLQRFGRSPPFAYLGARTRFFDDVVVSALDAGARQVVVFGAGYDTRAWRMTRPGVEFFEVDERATQADKRARAAAGGPRYVTVEIGGDDIEGSLVAAGFQQRVPTVFTIEGLTMYLAEADVVSLLETLARIGGGERWLAINFGVGFKAGGSARARVRTLVGRALVALGREQFRFELPPSDVPAFLARAGWRTDEVLAGPDVARRYLTGTGLPTDELNPLASVASARELRSQRWRPSATMNVSGDVAQLARAPALQAGGRGFESHRLHREAARRGAARRRRQRSRRSSCHPRAISVPRH
jgi:methyltransferase (TIGR00027 family)